MKAIFLKELRTYFKNPLGYVFIGMMLAILLMNLFAALIDHCFVQRNINKRLNRLNNK